METKAIADRLHEKFLNVAVCHCGSGLKNGGCDNHDAVWMPCPVSELLSDAEHAIRSTAAQLAAAENRAEVAEDFIASRGYRQCSIPACNCGRWHGGHLQERYEEIVQDLDDAGLYDAPGTTRPLRARVADVVTRLAAAEKVVEALERGIKAMEANDDVACENCERETMAALGAFRASYPPKPASGREENER